MLIGFACFQHHTEGRDMPRGPLGQTVNHPIAVPVGKMSGTDTALTLMKRWVLFHAGRGGAGPSKEMTILNFRFECSLCCLSLVCCEMPRSRGWRSPTPEAPRALGLEGRRRGRASGVEAPWITCKHVCVLTVP